MKEKYIGNPITKSLMNRKLSGVCAGIAEHYNYPVFSVRAAVVVAGLFFPVPIVLAYLLATLLMPTSRY